MGERVVAKQKWRSNLSWLAELYFQQKKNNKEPSLIGAVLANGKENKKHSETYKALRLTLI